MEFQTMNDPFQLVTNCNFKGKDYIVQMCVLNSKKLEIIITDKIMAEDWQCEYDASYIEALTHKTGNFKQFDVFVMMLKSGLLKTSDCITLDLLTLEDLEQLRCKKAVNSHSSIRTTQSTRLNKRYLILTYSVEFDRIHYPLPMDYCGPPDPTILQSNIRRLEGEIERLKQKNNLQYRNDVGDVNKLEEKIENLVEENKLLTNEINRLNKLISKRSNKPMRNNNQMLLNCLKKLEEQVLHEKNHNRQTIFKLRAENKDLKQQVENLKKSEKFLNWKLKDASKYGGSQKSCRGGFLRSTLGPDNSLDRKRPTTTSKRLDAQLSCRPVPSWNNSFTTNSFSGSSLKERAFLNILDVPHVTKAMKKSQNRFLSSSSSSSSNSESEGKQCHRARSREKKSTSRPNTFKTCRISSNDRSRCSSEGSKRNIQQRRSRLLLSKGSPSQEGKPRSLNFIQSVVKSQPELRSDSSLSSRGSSKHSRPSQFSNRASGDDGIALSKNVIPRSNLDGKEEIKFSMSDLEARIHSLQKLLSEGLNF